MVRNQGTKLLERLCHKIYRLGINRLSLMKINFLSLHSFHWYMIPGIQVV